MNTLSPEQWQRVNAVLDQVLDAAPDERAAMLEEACAGDEAVRRAVERLLDVEVPDFLETPALDVALPLLPNDPGDEQRAAGRDVGPYRVVGTLGRGGMGVVYLAERRDVPKKVALKLASAPVASSERAQRFLQERRLLAQLDHPHIAQLLDAGVTEADRPYFAMEYVEGRPLHRHCDEQRLSVEERLRLFATVGAAVHHAHRSLVVHCDLKPSNVLVTEDGTPKLLDFGIAKLLEGAEDPTAAPATRTGQRWMTPEYAAPEQIRGEAITTATDVYQLGVVLYELLAGCRPFEHNGAPLHNLEQAVLDEEPDPPSTAVSRVTEHSSGNNTPAVDAEEVGRTRSTEPERLQRTLRGDLDTICLKALRKEPARRYASAEAFVEDVKRYLEGLPVQARRDTFGYRAKKFVLRHRWGMAAGTAFVVLIAGFAVVMTVQANQIARERDRAQLEAEKSAQVTEFMMGLFDASNPDEARGENITAQKLLARGAKRAEALSDQPEVQAQMLEVTGRAYWRMGLYDKAQPLWERALALRRDVFGQEHAQVAKSLNDLGVLLKDKGDYSGAEPLLRQALKMRRKLLGATHKDVAVSLDEMARLLQKRGQYDRAEAFFRDALAMRRELLGDEHRQTATSQNDLALLLLKKGDYRAAEPLFRRALATYRKTFGNEHPYVVTTLNNLGLVLLEKRHYAAAESLYRRVVAMNRRLLGENHPYVANNANHLANALREQGKYGEADSLLREALQITRPALGNRHPRVARYLVSLARVHLARREAREAEPLLREALRIRQKVLPEGDWRVAEAQSQLGACLTALARYEDAEPLLIKGYEGLKAKRGNRDRRTQEALERLVALYEAWDKPEKAAQHRVRLADHATTTER